MSEGKKKTYSNIARDSQLVPSILAIVLWSMEAVGEVVWCVCLVVVGLRSVSLVVANLGKRAVDWQLKKHKVNIGTVTDLFDSYLLVVGSETMAVSISIREETSLEHLVRRWLDSRNKVS